MYKCKLCGKSFTEIQGLYNHIEKKHKNTIPKNMTVEQYYYYMKTGKTNGNCVMCKQPTTWNKNTCKYNRFCDDPRCKDEYRRIFKERMIGKYGKVHLLNDPNKQREMLANRSISGKYKWEDGTETVYTGSYEHDFLKMMDGFFDWDPSDIMMPSPHTYTYEYEGEKRYYIPDVFIPSLNLEIEIKDGGDNPNMHHKIQDVDKVKEKNKDEVMLSQKTFHYIKITNKNYSNFFDFLKEIKAGFEKYGDENKMPRIFKIEDIKGVKVKPVKESININTITNKIDEIERLRVRDLDKLTQHYMKCADDSDGFKHMREHAIQLMKRAKSMNDVLYIENIIQTLNHKALDSYQKNKITKEDMIEFDKWMKKDFAKEANKKRGKLKESSEFIINEINIDDVECEYVHESSISYSKLNDVLQASTDLKLKQYLQTYDDYYNRMLKERPEAVKHINDDVNKAVHYIEDLKRSGKVNPKLADEAIREFKHKGIAKKYICENSDNVSNIDLYLVFDPSKKRQVFSITDTNTKIFIGENLSMNRENVKCNIHPDSLYDNINGKRVIHLQAVLNEVVSYNLITTSIVKQDVRINNLYKLDGTNTLFFKEICNKLGINANINLISDKIYDGEGCEVDGK